VYYRVDDEIIFKRRGSDGREASVTPFPSDCCKLNFILIQMDD